MAGPAGGRSAGWARVRQMNSSFHCNAENQDERLLPGNLAAPSLNRSLIQGWEMKNPIRRLPSLSWIFGFSPGPERARQAFPPAVAGKIVR